MTNPPALPWVLRVYSSFHLHFTQRWLFLCKEVCLLVLTYVFHKDAKTVELKSRFTSECPPRIIPVRSLLHTQHCYFKSRLFVFFVVFLRCLDHWEVELRCTVDYLLFRCSIFVVLPVFLLYSLHPRYSLRYSKYKRKTSKCMKTLYVSSTLSTVHFNSTSQWSRHLSNTIEKTYNRLLK